MILIDANLMIDATMTTAPSHEPARSWLHQRLSGTVRVGLPWASITGFIRVAGEPRACEHPMPSNRAIAIVRS